jgi:hypothetical protein
MTQDIYRYFLSYSMKFIERKYCKYNLLVCWYHSTTPLKNFSLTGRVYDCHPVKGYLSIERPHILWHQRNTSCKFWSKEESLLCHTCCNTGPRFVCSGPKDRPFSLLLQQLRAIIRSFLVFSLFCVSSKFLNLPATKGKNKQA